MAGPGLFALRDFARLATPSVSLPPSTLLLETPKCIAVFDAYPKARYHFLVLPKLPFPGDTGLLEGNLDSLAALLRHPARGAVVDAMAAAADEVVEMVRDEMHKTEGFEWGVNVGFHSVPSMRHLHLHVISDDLTSPSLKNKKHYNSFRPDLGFFVPLGDVQQWITDAGDGGDLDARATALHANETLLTTPLSCFKCDEGMSNMPALKRHLDEEWQNAKAKATSTSLTR